MPNATYPEIGFRLKWIRCRLNLTLRDLEEKCGVSASTLSRIENGSAGDVSLAAFLGVCAALETPVADILHAANQS